MKACARPGCRNNERSFIFPQNEEMRQPFDAPKLIGLRPSKSFHAQVLHFRYSPDFPTYRCTAPLGDQSVNPR
jgi:hypothetical protein